MSTGLCGSEPYIAPEQFLGKRKPRSLASRWGNLTRCVLFDSYRLDNPIILKCGCVLVAYDARLVDIWACGIVYYCLHFSELPWRAAQPATDPLYQAYAAACANQNATVSACPTTINNLNPRACRPLLRKMLEPDPKHRYKIEEVIKHSWVQTIEICHESSQPRHMHINARAMGMANRLEWNWVSFSQPSALWCSDLDHSWCPH